MVRKTKEDAEKTRELLLDAAEYVFMHKGVSNATLEQIARQAGMTRGAVYWHFDNKCDIFRAMQERVKMPLDASLDRVMLQENPLQALEDHCVHVLQKLEKDEHVQRVFFITLFKCELTEPFAEASIYQKEKREKLLHKFTEIFGWAEKQGRLSDRFTPQKAAMALYAYIVGVLNIYLRDRDYFDMERQAAALVNLFFRGATR